MTAEGTNGYVRWRDLDERENRVRTEMLAIHHAMDQNVKERLDKVNACQDHLEDRLDKVESVLDQQRGARNLIVTLIGTNLLLAVGTGLALLAAVANIINA